MKKAANNIFTGIRNMKFFKRTAISLALASGPPCYSLLSMSRCTSGWPPTADGLCSPASLVLRLCCIRPTSQSW